MRTGAWNFGPAAMAGAAALFAVVAAAFGGADIADAAGRTAARVAKVGSDPNATAAVWLETSLHRVFPDTPPGSSDLSLLAPRNGRIAFQACVRSGDVQVLYTEVKLDGADDLKPRVRFEELVPVKAFSAPMSDADGTSPAWCPTR
jgi:hypothetical protein